MQVILVISVWWNEKCLKKEHGDRSRRGRTQVPTIAYLLITALRCQIRNFRVRKTHHTLCIIWDGHTTVWLSVLLNIRGTKTIVLFFEGRLMFQPLGFYITATPITSFAPSWFGNRNWYILLCVVFNISHYLHEVANLIVFLWNISLTTRFQ